jgi:hypothetical protein
MLSIAQPVVELVRYALIISLSMVALDRVVDQLYD